MVMADRNSEDYRNGRRSRGASPNDYSDDSDLDCPEQGERSIKLFIFLCCCFLSDKRENFYKFSCHFFLFFFIPQRIACVSVLTTKHRYLHITQASFTEISQIHASPRTGKV